MKNKSTFTSIALALLGFLTISAQLSTGLAQGTAFTYQGRLNDGANAAHGSYDLTFSLYNVSSGGSAVAGPLSTNAVAVSNGLFTVALDFGAGVFNGTGYWLEVGVRTNGGGAFVPLSPRQQLTPAPYAIYAESVTASGISGTIPTANFGGTYGNVVNFNNGADSFDGSFYGLFYGASFVGGNFVGDFIGSGSGLTDVWHTGGNSGTTAGVNFVGTTDNQPLEMHVAAVRALRLEPDTTGGGAPNVIGGSPANFMDTGDVIGGFIGGGGALNFNGVGYTNRISAYFASIVGGYGNWIQTYGNNAFIGGGYFNTVQTGGGLSVIGGGNNNTIGTNNSYSVIGGGQFNTANSTWATIDGGYGNSAGYVGTVGGGDANAASGNFSFVGGGYQNTASSFASVIGGGYLNSISTNAGYNYAVIGGGYYNGIGAAGAVVAGGYFNTNAGLASFIGAGYLNNVQSNSSYSVISGGFNNQLQPGSSDCFIGGGYGNVIQTNPPYPQIQYATIAGGSQNANHGTYGSIGGGAGNNVFGDYATISGGNNNSANWESAVGGGAKNAASGLGAVVAGGGIWLSNNFLITVGNTALGNSSAVLGGAANYAGGTYSAVGGGYQNTANADFSIVPGGSNSVASGILSFAAGRRARAERMGEFVWADSLDFDFDPFAQSGPQGVDNSFNVRSTGGFYIVTGVNGSGLITSGAYLGASSTSWSTLSDRNAKKDFAPVDYQAVLNKLAKVPIEQWHYKWEKDTDVPNLGPMAQDFKAAFYPGRDEKGITTLEFDGVELAAIQGLNQKLNEKDAEIQKLKEKADRVDSLEKRLNELEQTVQSLAANK